MSLYNIPGLAGLVSAAVRSDEVTKWRRDRKPLFDGWLYLDKAISEAAGRLPAAPEDSLPPGSMPISLNTRLVDAAFGDANAAPPRLVVHDVLTRRPVQPGKASEDSIVSREEFNRWLSSTSGLAVAPLPLSSAPLDTTLRAPKDEIPGDREPYWRAKVLQTVVDLGYDPKALPWIKSGTRCPVMKRAREILQKDPKVPGDTRKMTYAVFEKAWKNCGLERLKEPPKASEPPGQTSVFDQPAAKAIAADSMSTSTPAAKMPTRPKR